MSTLIELFGSAANLIWAVVALVTALTGLLTALRAVKRIPGR